MSLRSGYELATVGASSSIHPPAVATDRIPIRLQIFAWVTAKDPAGVAFNLARPVVEQHRHVPIFFMSDGYRLHTSLWLHALQIGM